VAEKMVRWDGERWPLVESPTFEEMSVIERGAGAGWDALSSIEVSAGMVLVTLRRHGVILAWADVLQLEPGQVLEIGEREPDPTPAGDVPASPVLAGPAAEAATRSTAGTRSRRAAPAGSPTKPPRRSRTGSTATS